MGYTALEWKRKINSRGSEVKYFLDTFKIRSTPTAIYSVGLSELPDDQQDMIMGRLIMEFDPVQAETENGE